MASLAADSQSKFGQARYVVDAADLTTAREMGLLREGVKVESDDSLSADYGVAYDRQNNIADNSFASQKLACACCKSFAVSELAESKSDAAEYLDKIDEKYWVKLKFREALNLPTYNEITSNLSEQANNWMGTELRSAKPLDAISLYFRKLSELT
ncbi:hypothetical protein PC110_g22713, partial [Phytophthora cactorum]